MQPILKLAVLGLLPASLFACAGEGSGALPDVNATSQAVLSGLTPAQLAAAYPRLGTKSNPLMVVVGIKGYPRLQTDLNTFGSNYSRTVPTVTKWSQGGTHTLPSAFDLGFAQAQAIGIQTIAGICNGDCSMAVVDADTDGMTDVDTATSFAASLNPDAILLTFVADPTVGAGHHLTSGFAWFAPAGPSGQFWWPASDGSAVDVAPTNLQMSGNSITSEVETSEGGQGCTSVAKQTNENNGGLCTNHASPVISAVGSSSSPIQAIIPTSSTASSGADVSGTVVSAAVATAQAGFNANIATPAKVQAAQGTTKLTRLSGKTAYTFNQGNGRLQSGTL